MFGFEFSVTKTIEIDPTKAAHLAMMQCCRQGAISVPSNAYASAVGLSLGFEGGVRKDNELVTGTTQRFSHQCASGRVLLQLPKGGGTDRGVSWMILEASV